jgi:anti-anti-sigma factor
VITSGVVGDQVSLGLGGAIDASNAGCLRSALFDRIDRGGTTVVIDITVLTFIDCAGLAVLRAAARVDAGRGSLRSCGAARPCVHRLLEPTGVSALGDQWSPGRGGSEGQGVSATTPRSRGAAAMAAEPA